MTERINNPDQREGISTGVIEGTATGGPAIRIPKIAAKIFEGISEGEKDTMKPSEDKAPVTKFFSSSPVSRRPSLSQSKRRASRSPNQPVIKLQQSQKVENDNAKTVNKLFNQLEYKT